MARTLVLALFLLVGCGDSRDDLDGSRPGLDAAVPDGSAPDGSRPGTDGSAPDGSRPGTDGSAPDGSGGTDGGPGRTASFCVLGCTVTSDCTTPSPAFDADNYRCEGGSCRYTGCVSDAECQSTFSNPTYVCRDSGTGLRSCRQGCSTAADCGSATPAFDADNYRCDSGLCAYAGCNADAECEASFGAAYGCFSVEPPMTPVPIPTADANCVRRCTTSVDCATDSGAFDADNYSCEAGACHYDGCNDDAECRTSLSSASYVCR